MKSKIIFNGFLLSIFIIMSSVIRVNALKIYDLDPAPEFDNVFLDSDCENDPHCMAVCGYEWVETKKTADWFDGDATIKVYSNATIFYKDGKWRVWFTPYPRGVDLANTDSVSTIAYSTGFVNASSLFNSDRIHIKTGDWNGASTFKCPKYFYPDMADAFTQTRAEACFDSDGKSCNGISATADQQFSKKDKTHNTKKTYSIFDQIERYHSNIVMDMDCSILIDKENGYVNEDGTLNNEKISDYFGDKIAKDFSLNFLNRGNKDGTVEIPTFMANHGSYKKLYEPLEGEEFKKTISKIHDKCDPELKALLDEGKITENDYENAVTGIDNLQPENIIADEVKMKYYMTYTVKGEPLPTDPDCAAILSADVTKLFLTVLRYIQYLGPVLVVVLSTVDFIKAAASGSPDDMKKAWNKLVKRLIAAILLFFVALITRLLLSFFDITVPESCLK